MIINFRVTCRFTETPLAGVSVDGFSQTKTARLHGLID
jgi:hypothetical protein